MGDDRNDENKIVASFHSIMTRFHNKVARDVRSTSVRPVERPGVRRGPSASDVVLPVGLLRTSCRRCPTEGGRRKTAKFDGKRWKTNVRFYDTCRGSIPTEFAVASYRWHTMVRDDYIVNDQIKDLPIFNGPRDPRANLAGFQPSPSDFGFDWDYFFAGGDEEAQKAYKFDNSLVPALGILPGGAAGAGPTNLSTRNLLRGSQVGLPTGQDLARALGIKVLADDQIIVGPALGVGAETNPSRSSRRRSPAGPRCGPMLPPSRSTRDSRSARTHRRRRHQEATARPIRPSS